MTPTPVAKPPDPGITKVMGGLRKPKRGEVHNLVSQHDVATLSINDSAKALMDIANEKGFSTTDGTLKNLIGAHRRSLGIMSRQQKAATVVKPVMNVDRLPPIDEILISKELPPTPRLKEPSPEEVTDLLKLFDDAIAGLQLTRGAVERMALENRELRVIKVRMEKLVRGDLS